MEAGQKFIRTWKMILCRVSLLSSAICYPSSQRVLRLPNRIRTKAINSAKMQFTDAVFQFANIMNKREHHHNSIKNSELVIKQSFFHHKSCNVFSKYLQKSSADPPCSEIRSDPLRHERNDFLPETAKTPFTTTTNRL